MNSDVSVERPEPGAIPSRDTGLLGVLAETAYPRKVASARVRIASFVPFLRQEGVALSYSPTLTDADYEILASSGRIAGKSAVLARASARALLHKREEHTLLLIHRLRLLNPLPGFDPPGHLDIYDIDDPLFVPFNGGVNQRFRWAKREVHRCAECLRRARLVLAGNSYLAGRAREYNRQVEVLPSCVDPAQQPMRAHHQREPVTVGWIGSAPTSPYLRPVLPVFARLNAQGVRARLVLVGADRRITAPWIEHRGWSLSTEKDDLASFDIGIMPQPDDEWARGKCGYKVLQYFAAGVPAVGSPVGVTRVLIGSERGLIADTPDQWHRALIALIEDPAQRAGQGRAGREFVEEHYSYRRWAPELAGLMRSIAG